MQGTINYFSKSMQDTVYNVRSDTYICSILSEADIWGSEGTSTTCLVKDLLAVQKLIQMKERIVLTVQW